MVGLGMSPMDIFLHMLSKADSIPLGRRPEPQTSIFSLRGMLRVVSPTACTGTQYLQAVGMAKAVKAAGKGKRDRVRVVR